MAPRLSLGRFESEEAQGAVRSAHGRQLRYEEHQRGMEGSRGRLIQTELQRVEEALDSKSVQRLLLRLQDKADNPALGGNRSRLDRCHHAEHLKARISVAAARPSQHGHVLELRHDYGHLQHFVAVCAEGARTQLISAKSSSNVPDTSKKDDTYTLH